MDNSKSSQLSLHYEIGIAKSFINIYTGRLLCDIPLFKIGANNFEITTSLMYNSFSLNNDFEKRQIGFGNGWKLNIEQQIFPYKKIYNLKDFSVGDYVYIDSAWITHRFVKYKEKTIDNKITAIYYDTLGTNLILEIGKEIKVYDTNKNILIFNNNGYLTDMISGINSNINKKIEYENNNISSIYDIRKPWRKLLFKYTNNKLTSVELKSNTIDPFPKDYYLYLVYDNNNFLKEIVKKIDYVNMYSSSKTLFNFQYYDNDYKLLSSIKDPIKKDVLQFEYLYNSNALEQKINLITMAVMGYDYDTKKSSETYVGEEKFLGDNIFLTDEYVDLMQKIEKIEYIKDYNKFVYNGINTIINDKKSHNIVYYFNNNGDNVSFFEFKNDINNLFSTKELKGYSVFKDGNGDTVINNKRSILSENNELILNVDPNEGLEKIFKVIHNKYAEKFIMSFWLKCSEPVYNECKIWTSYSINKDNEHTISEINLNATEKNVWQEINLPISLQSQYCQDVNEFVLYISGFSTSTKIEIADVRIFPDTSQVIKIAEFGEFPREITISSEKATIGNTQDYLDIISIIDITDGKETSNIINENFYLTENDFLETYKNMCYRRDENNKFDLVYCNSTKIKNVDSLKIRKQKTKINDKVDIDFVINSDGMLNFYMAFSDKIDNAYSNKTETRYLLNLNKDTNKYDFSTRLTITNVMNDKTEINSWSPSKSITKYSENGLLISKIDDYDVIIEHKYDNYGNILTVSKYNLKNKNNTITTFYNYAEEDTFREMSYCINENGIDRYFTYNKPFFTTDTIKMGNQLAQYSYNLFDDLIVSIDNKEAVPEENNPYIHLNTVEIYYDENERVKTYVDNRNNYHNFFYDSSDNVTEYCRNEVPIFKSNCYDGLKYSSDIFGEKKHKIELLLDEYHRIIKQKFDNLEYIYTYDNEDIGSKFLSRVKKIEDNQHNEKYEFDYSISNNAKKITTNDLSIIYDNDDVVEYFIKGKHVKRINSKDNSQYDTTNSNYLKLIKPRVNKTKYEEVDNEGKITNEFIELNYDYLYDDFGRIESINSQKYEYKLNPFDDGLDLNTYVYVNKKINYEVGTALLKNITYTVHSDENQVFTAPKEDHADFIYAITQYTNTGCIEQVIERGRCYLTNPIDNKYLDKKILPTRIYDFCYDSFSRLISEKITETSTKLNKYEYDVNGNLTKIIEENNNITKIKIFTYEHNQIKTYEDSDLNQYNFKYNQYGNLTNIINENNKENFINIGYNSRNLLDTYLNQKFNNKISVNYYYNLYGIRTKKIIIKETNGQEKEIIETKYYLDDEKIIREERTIGNNVETMEYFYNIEGICGIRYKENNFNLVRDAFGNISKVMYRGKIIGEYVYDAWGNCEIFEIGIDSETEAQQRDKYVLYNNPFRYKGYYYDEETNFYLCNSQYYSPELKRFIDISNFNTLNPKNINGLNLYIYANNDPINTLYTSQTSGELKNSLFIDNSYIKQGTGYSEIILPELPKIITKLPAIINTISTTTDSIENIFFYLKHAKVINDERILSGVSYFVTAKYVANIQWKISGLDAFLISLDVFINACDNYQRGVNFANSVVNIMCTIVLDVGLVFMDKGILIITTTIGLAINPLVGGAVGIVVGIAIMFFADSIIGTYVDEWIDKIDLFE